MNETNKTLAELHQDIRNAIKTGGPYWQNLVGHYLRLIAGVYGVKIANKTIMNLGLVRKGWGLMK